MYNHLSIYEEFFGVKEGELLSFSFFRKPIRNTEPLRCIGIPDIYRYIVGPYAKKQTEMLRSITGKDQARKYKAENFDFCTFSGIFHTRNKDACCSNPICFASTSTMWLTFLRCMKNCSMTLALRPNYSFVHLRAMG